MKLLYVGTFSGRHVSDHFRLKGFIEAGLDTIHVDYRKLVQSAGRPYMHQRIRELALQCDAMFINKGELIHPDNLQKIKIPKVYWYGDQRGGVWPKAAELGAVCDVFTMSNNDPNLIQQYRDAGVKCLIKPYHCATDKDMFNNKHRTKTTKIRELLFAGGFYYNEFEDSFLRLELLRYLKDNGIGVYAIGGNWPMDIPSSREPQYRMAFVEEMDKSQISFGINAYNRVYQYTSNRTWNTMACGIPYACWYFNGLETMFRPDEHMIVASEREELYKKIRYYLDHPDEAEEIGKSGMKFVHENHTYYHRALEFLSFLEEL